MGVICRPILLHNEYVPAIIGSREHKYLVLGHHDGMTIERAYSINTAYSFEEIFTLNAKYEGRFSRYSTQFFYAFHEETKAEDLFWEMDCPFTFVSFVQFENRDIGRYQEYLESLQYKKDEEILGLSEPMSEFHVMVYYTLDSSDIILVLRCGRCGTGTQIINNLHQNVNDCHPFSVRNSYSILAIDRDYIENDKKCELLEERIEWLECRVIERESGSINALYNEIQADLQSALDVSVERKGLMGTEDEAILIHNLRWKDLLPFYKQDTGLLMNSNRISQQYVSAITTKILYPIIKAKKDPCETCMTESPTPFCDFLYQKIEMIYDNHCKEFHLAERKNLVMLVNALRKVEYSNYLGKNFNDYCFYTIMMPTAMFIRLRALDPNNAAEFYEFIKYVKLCMQNCAKPDRVYQQISDLNIRHFDIPSKVVALYNAYLYYAKRALNIGTKGEYEFLLCPGMNRQTEVKELYRGTDAYFAFEGSPQEIHSHHLFRVELPEFHLYSTKLMFFVLGHEVSHFVGRLIRKREERYESILMLTSRIIVQCLRQLIRNTAEFKEVCFDEDSWDVIRKEIRDHLKFHVEGHLDMEYMAGSEYDTETEKAIQRLINYNKIFYQHTTTLEILLNRAVSKTLQCKGKELFYDLIWRDVNQAIRDNDISYADRNKLFEKLQRQITECIGYLEEERSSLEKDVTIKAGIKVILYLLEECYADMSCILLLHLSLKDYLGHLIKMLHTNGYRVDEVKGTSLISRIAIVMTAMSYKVEEAEKNQGCFFWDDNEILAEKQSDIFELQEEALNYTHAYIRNQVHEGRDGDAKKNLIQDIFLDSKMHKEIITYLLKCRREYYRNVTLSDEKKVRRFYELANEVDAVGFYIKSTSILDEYEKDIYQEMQKLKESEEKGDGKC